MRDGLGNYGYSFEYQLQGKPKWHRQTVWCKNETERDVFLDKSSKLKPEGVFTAYRKFEKRVR